MILLINPPAALSTCSKFGVTGCRGGSRSRRQAQVMIRILIPLCFVSKPLFSLGLYLLSLSKLGVSGPASTLLFRGIQCMYTIIFNTILALRIACESQSKKSGCVYSPSLYVCHLLRCYAFKRQVSFQMMMHLFLSKISRST